MKRTTIEDVAKHAGVGKVTVSYVLNGRSKTARISSSTAERVLESARVLNYKPNALARMLVTKRTEVLAVVFQRGSMFSTWSAFTSEVMRGVSTAAVELGYDIMLHTRDLVGTAESDALCDGRVDGALVLRDEGDATLNALTERDFPTVQFFTRSEGQNLAYVDADNYAGGRMATRHLIELGHQRVAMVRGSMRSTSSNDRYNGYRDALEGAGIGVGPERVLSIPSPSSDFEPLRQLMTSPSRPTALFVWSDDVAMICMQVLAELGLSVPDDVSVVGFDSLAECERSFPPLTSINQPIATMAQTATQLLVALVRGETPTQRQVVYPLSLDIRASTAPPMGKKGGVQ